MARLKNIVLSMPEKPGSYQYYDENHTIIYVGKAKNLKRRVSSYFHKEVDRYKTKVLVSKIFDISYTVVNTEEDALLLENSLIKKYNPRYNVLLKDGKTYPSICVTNEYFPRIFKTRNINKKVGTFFGPYPHVGSMYAVLEVIKKLYKPRTCRFPITKEGVAEGKYKPCLEYHIHNCGAPCINKQSYEEYQENMRQAREILKGNTREVGKYLYDLMMKNAELLRFEIAEEYKKKYQLLDEFEAEKLNPEQKQTRLMKELQTKLKLPKMPYQIECFDNSNISGTDAVAGCIVYKGMKPSRKDYRKYNIKTVEGPDDYASMQEVVRRRYSRMIEEETPLPDLIITDGGKGQMEVVREVIEDELHLEIPIAGLAKDDRHRTNELLYGFPPQAIALPPESELFKVLTQIQDEVHRYAITFHRDKRSKHALHSELDDIKGIGPKAKEALLSKFKSVKKIKEASLEQLAEVLGPHKAEILAKYFAEKGENMK